MNGAEGQSSTTLTLPGDATATATFDVDWSGCPDGEYTVQADACHPGDPAPSGFFGSGGCPGTDPHVPQPPSAQLTPSDATASSEAFGPAFGALKAIDNDGDTSWCTIFQPDVNIEVSFSSPVSVDQVDIENTQMSPLGYSFDTGTLTFSTGYSQDVTLLGGGGQYSVPLQSGVEWVRFTGTGASSPFVCMSEFKTIGFVPPAGDTNTLDDAPRSVNVTVGTP